MAERIFLVRHGETAWSLSGQHTGMSDIPLTENGKAQARALGEELRALSFTKALVSPLVRAQTTFELLGLSTPHALEEDLLEWNYGKYEGVTTKEIHKTVPSWSVFTSGAPEGESPLDVQARAKKVLAKVDQIEGNVLLCSSGHFLRALTATWLGLEITAGAKFKLFPASLSILGYEHEKPAIELWNQNARKR